MNSSDGKSPRGACPFFFIGARQVGKIWLLREFGKRSFENVCEVNFDGNDEVKAIFEGAYDIPQILRNLSAITETDTSPEKTLIIFDEIQECSQERLILEAMQENSHITYDELAKYLGVGQATVARAIASLRDEHIIARIGGRRDGHWELLGG